MHEPTSRPSLRAIACALIGAGLALAYDAVALLPLWVTHVPLSWSAAVRDVGRPLRLAFALSSFAALWWGLYALHGAKAVKRGRQWRWDAFLLWGGTAVAVVLLAFPAFLGG